MLRFAAFVFSIPLTLIFVSPLFAVPFELASTTDKKISSHLFSCAVDSFKELYSIASGVERDVILDGIESGSIYYLGFDLNLDNFFNYNQATSYELLTEQKYTINKLNIQVKLKDDNYTFLGTNLGNDIPHEYGRIDIQLWTEDIDTFGGRWPNPSDFFDHSTNEIDDGDEFTLSIDFSQNSLNYTDWYNKGEIVVTAWHPEFIANSDFIVDSVKVWGDRSIYVTPEPLNSVPEPSTILLLSSGLLGLGLYARKRKKA